MVIRSGQMDVFNEEAHRAFERRLVEYLRDRYGQTPVPTAAAEVPLSKLPQVVLEKMVAYGVRKAELYGLRKQPQLAAFVTLMFLDGPRFDEDPEVKVELRDATIPDSCRMDHVCAVVPQRVWQAIRSRYDAGSWREARSV